MSVVVPLVVVVVGFAAASVEAVAWASSVEVSILNCQCNVWKRKRDVWKEKKELRLFETINDRLDGFKRLLWWKLRMFGNINFIVAATNNNE
jgi:hypothetical protein